jgi:DNA-binding response OmpR family regulator
MLPVENADALVGSGRLQGVRVFLVEDEPLICMLLEDMLAELGCKLVASASNFAQASELARRAEQIDVAILDVHLGDRPVFPLAGFLAERGVPLLFCTGLGADGLPPEWRGCGTLGKPLTIEALSGGLKRALEPAGRAAEANGRSAGRTIT